MEEKINKIIKNIPEKEYNHYYNAYKELNPDINEKETRIMMLKVKYANSICQNCKTKGINVLLHLCKECRLVFYCSDYCEDEDSKKHSLYCCNLNFDYNPKNDLYASVLINLKNKEVTIYNK